MLREKEKVLWVDVMNTKFSLSLQMSIIVNVLSSILKFFFFFHRCETHLKIASFTSWIISIFSYMYPKYDRSKINWMKMFDENETWSHENWKFFKVIFFHVSVNDKMKIHRQHTDTRKLLMGVHEFWNLMSLLLSRMKSFLLWTWCSV